MNWKLYLNREEEHASLFARAMKHTEGMMERFRQVSMAKVAESWCKRKRRKALKNGD